MTTALQYDGTAKVERDWTEGDKVRYRAEVIEECARIVDVWRRGYGLKYLAEAIRALKEGK